MVVKTHIEKLTTLRKTESLSGYASPSLSLRSQLSNGSSFDDSPSASQAIFATQAPSPTHPVLASLNQTTLALELMWAWVL